MSIDFSDFLAFPIYTGTNEVGLKQMMPAFFHFQHTLNRLFNNYIKTLDKFFLKYDGVGSQIGPTPRKNYPQKAQPY